MIQKRTKIICTIGPSSWDEETLTRLVKAGMDVARLNFSHGNQEEKRAQIQLVRKISKELNKPLMILADMSGPKLRLGSFEGIREIQKGDIIQLSLNPIENEIPIQFDLTPFIKENQRIFLNDGLVEVNVVEVRNKIIRAKAQNNGVISSNKGVNIPDTNLKGASFTQKDYEDARFAIEENVDFLALSFIQTPQDLLPARNLIKSKGKKTRIMVKIEKAEAVKNLEQIIKLSDAVMVARGDLAIEIPASEVPIVQQKTVRIARQYNKPVVIATQMLESMIENPRPTRAETSDVANAVLDQADAVMLSAESASGKYPLEAVEVMRDIILSVEEHPDYNNLISINWESIPKEELSYSAIASSAASLASRVDAKIIAVATATGRSARLISSFRPSSLIIAVTDDALVKNQLSLVWGVHPILIEPASDSGSLWKKILEAVSNYEIAKKGDKIVMVSGTKVGATGATDTIKVVTI
jgi:pyruvate kinase